IGINDHQVKTVERISRKLVECLCVSIDMFKTKATITHFISEQELMTLFEERFELTCLETRVVQHESNIQLTLFPNMHRYLTDGVVIEQHRVEVIASLLWEKS